MSAGGAFGWVFLRGLEAQPLQEARCRSRHPNRSNQVREVLSGSPGRLGALRLLCHLAGQTTHAPGLELRFREPIRQDGSLCCVRCREGSFWIARGFRGFFKNFIFKGESPSILQYSHSLQLSSGCDGYVPLKLDWKTGILIPLGEKYISICLEMVFWPLPLFFSPRVCQCQVRVLDRPERTGSALFAGWGG